MPKITSIEVSNFRSIKNVQLDCEKLNPIVGYNNSGKSNLMRAIYWLLKKSVLTSNDFNDPTSPLWVSATIDEASNLISVLPINQQQQITPYISNDTLTFRRIQPIPSCTPAQVKYEILDHQQSWVTNPTGLDNAIGKAFPDPVYIKAMDDAEDDVAKFSAKNTIGLLIKYAFELAKANNAANIQNLTADLATVGNHLNGPGRLNEINQLEQDATNSLSNLFPGISIKLEMPTPSIDEIIKSTTIKLIENGGQERDFSSYGHGTQRTVQMSLINLLAQNISQTGNQNTNTVILIDEPELYLHPQAIGKVRVALKLISQSNFQVFFSTHSPIMIGETDAPHTTVFWKCPNNGTKPRIKASSALSLPSPGNANDVLFSLNHSAQWLFSEKPVIVEGKTERVLLPTIYEACTGNKIFDSSIALIESGGGSSSYDISNLFKHLGYSPKRICDLDFAFKLAQGEGLLDINDPDITSCKQWFSNNCTNHNISLDGNGLPTKSPNTVKAEEAYKIMAANNTSSCGSIHHKLLSKNVWVWQMGAIESHLGIDKNNNAKATFANTTKINKSVAHASHSQSLIDLCQWISL